MPIYRVNGKVYDIPESKMLGFEATYHNATIEYYVADNKYELPVSKKEGFIKKFPNATTEKPLDDISKLYNAMVSAGYDVDDLGGSENNFRASMGDKQTRKDFYDWVSDNEIGNFRIGDYDEYEQRIKVALQVSGENLKNIYKTLQEEGYELPEFEIFKEDMRKDENLLQIYETLLREGYTQPEFSFFKIEMFGYKKTFNVENARKLYDALSEEYNLGTFEQFSLDIQDAEKRRKLYDEIIQYYDLGDYKQFNSQLGFTIKGHDTDIQSLRNDSTNNLINTIEEPYQQELSSNDIKTYSIIGLVIIEIIIITFLIIRRMKSDTR